MMSHKKDFHRGNLTTHKLKHPPNYIHQMNLSLHPYKVELHLFDTMKGIGKVFPSTPRLKAIKETFAGTQSECFKMISRFSRKRVHEESV